MVLALPEASYKDLFMSWGMLVSATRRPRARMMMCCAMLVLELTQASFGTLVYYGACSGLGYEPSPVVLLPGLGRG